MNGRTLAFWLTLCAAIMLLASACKNDKKITGPDNPNPGNFTLELRANDTLHYNIDNPIVVRLYNGTGMAVNDTVRFITQSGVGFMDDALVIPQSDTVAHACGSNPCAKYICQDTTVAKDAIFGFAISNGDTVATAQIGFFLKH
ncbi:MAG: hypothetical protein IPP40_02895 [bacterium]|nr:hypothetical protein [bacterium]